MIEIEALRQETEAAAARLADADAERLRERDVLMATLAKLEAKFADEEAELEHCKARIGPLEADNRELTTILTSLLDGVESSVDAPIENPRSAVAVDPIIEPETPFEDSGNSQEPWFEDASPEELLAEELTELEALGHKIGDAEAGDAEERLFAEVLAETVGDAIGTDIDIPDPNDVVSRLPIKPSGVEDIIARIEEVANALAGQRSFAPDEESRSKDEENSNAGRSGEQVA